MTILDKIAASRRTEIERLKTAEPLEHFIAALEGLEPARFAQTLSEGESVKIIAEMKKRSPSRGVLSSEFDPVKLAARYEQGGAVAFSVLTEPSFFEGSYDDLKAVGRSSSLPILCKDFVVDRYQIFHARHIGAECILLIVALQSARELARHLRLTEQIGLDCLVEVHDSTEVKIAVDAGSKIIGVNNRNLNDFSVSLRTAEELAIGIPSDIIKVAESGIGHAGDINRLRRSGYDCFLVGETLVKADDPIQTLKGMING